MHTSDPVLSLENLTVAYGHANAITDVSLRVAPGETLALIGPNGAGKTTLLRSVMNQERKSSGRIRLCGRDVSTVRTARLVRAGIVHVPEGRHIVAPLTVQENLQLAAAAAHRCPRREIRESVAMVYELFSPLVRLRNKPAGLLSGGEQQMVAIGRALVARPIVLLLDEPSMGLAPVMVETIYTFLAQQRELLGGVAIILAEQSRIALDVADRAAVLSGGRVVFEGSSSELDDSTIAAAYLGKAQASVAD
ncbi:MAG TPA: ABC transporter ATP-binding protein [Aldersonia sp.]